MGKERRRPKKKDLILYHSEQGMRAHQYFTQPIRFHQRQELLVLMGRERKKSKTGNIFSLFPTFVSVHKENE